MKILTNDSKHLFIAICILGWLPFLFSSCVKEPINVNTPPAALSAISLIQASPDEPPVDLYLNGANFYSSPLSYAQSIGYSYVYAGGTKLIFNNDATGKAIITDSVNFIQNTTYSVFLANKATNPEVVILTDTLNQPASGLASARFINLSPDAPAVDLVIKGGSTLVTNRSYKGYSSFATLPGNAVYTFEVHQAGTATVLATLNNVKLQSGFIYTLWFHGLVNNTSTTDQLNLDIFNNAYFL